MSGRDLAVFSLPVLVYLSLALYQLRLPGPEYDEVFFGPATLGQTQDFSNPVATPVPADSAARFSPLAFTTFALHWGDTRLPVMLMPYWGALKAWLLAPWFAWLGASIELIRLSAVVVGAAALVCFLGVARSCSPWPVALLAGLLVATDPSYLFYTRHDFGGAGLSLLVMLGSLLCLGGWWTTGRLRYWAAAFGLFGLGLYHRLDFMAFLLALGGSGLWWARARWRECPAPRAWKPVGLAVLAFVAGGSPFLMFVWQRPAIAASSLSLAAPGSENVSELLAVARLKGYVLGTVLNGTALYDFFADRSGLSVGRHVAPDGEKRVGLFRPDQPLRLRSLWTGSLTPYVFIVLSGSLVFMRAPPVVRRLGLFLVLFGGCLFLVRGALRGHHFVVLVPAVCAFVAVAGSHVFQTLKRPWGRAGLLALGLGCLGTNLALDLRYHQLLATTGGRGIWSEAIYDVTRYLEQRCPERVCLLGDWGLGTQIVTLSAGRLAVEEMFWPYLTPPADTPSQPSAAPARLVQLLQTDAPVLVFYADRYVNFSRPKQLVYQAAEQAGLGLALEQVFTDREGTPVIEVVSVQIPPDSGETLSGFPAYGQEGHAPGQTIMFLEPQERHQKVIHLGLEVWNGAAFEEP